MATIKYRLAKRPDARQIANLHWESSKKQPSSFMFKLGALFLAKYYRYILDEKNSVILCAVDENDNLLGFVSGSMDNSERIKTLRNKRFSLLLAAAPQIIIKPKLIKEILSRYYSNSAESDDGYVVQDGPHEDFWAWDASQKSGNEAILLHLAWLKMVGLMGTNYVRGETDEQNTLVLKIHKFLGAKIVREYRTPDNRKRYIFEYDLKKLS